MTTPDAAMLPCPFCGKTNVRVEAGEYVHCTDCTADGPYFASDGDRSAEAIAAWNTRASQAHIAARLRERAYAATGSAQAVMYEIVRLIEEGTL